MTIRTVKESPVTQGEDEVVVYTLTTTPWGSAPSDVSVKVFDISSTPWVDVTATVMPTNSPVVEGDVITLSSLSGLEDGKHYRLEVRFTSGTSTFETNCLIYGGV